MPSNLTTRVDAFSHRTDRPRRRSAVLRWKPLNSTSRGFVVAVLLVAASVAALTTAFATGLAASAPAFPSGEFDWPLRPRPAVVRAFDKPEHDWLPGHRGVDLAGSGGQAVLAAGDGVVVYAGKVADKPVVSIDHTGGLRTTYEPVTAAIPVGRRVTRGSPIGALEPGHTPCSPCLHWGLRRDREYLDPLTLLHHTPVRLKPLTSHPANGSEPKDLTTPEFSMAAHGLAGPAPSTRESPAAPNSRPKGRRPSPSVSVSGAARIRGTSPPPGPVGARTCRDGGGTAAGSGVRIHSAPSTPVDGGRRGWGHDR